MRRLLIALFTTTVLAVACAPAPDAEPLGEPRIEVLTSGLLNPVGLAMLPDGRLLVAEEGTGEDDLTAGVSILEGGTTRRLITGLPSGRDSGDLSGVPLVAVSPDGSTIYTANFGEGHVWTLPVDAVDSGSTFDPSDLGVAMNRLNDVFLTNPFDMTFDADGRPVVADASQNGVATVNDDGTTRFIHRFGSLADPAKESLQIDPVPTGIARIGEEFFVALTGGCPYPAGSGEVVAIDGDRGQRTVIGGLNMPIDVTEAPDGTIWVLEFAEFDPDASCFTGQGYRPGTGRLSRLVDGVLQEAVGGLDFPGAVLAIDDGSLIVSEVFAGRVVRITFGDDEQAELPPESGRLISMAPDAGIDFTHGAFVTGLSADPAAMMGAGLCWIDYDRDGWLDLYLVNSHASAEIGHWNQAGGLPTNALYRNVAGRFVDVSEATDTDVAVRGNGCLAADLDSDGWTDLFITADGPNVVLRNDGGGRFEDVSSGSRLDTPEWNSAAAAADLNGDGLLEVFVGGYIDLANKIDKPSGAFPQDYHGIPDRLFVNDGSMRFTEVTAAAGLNLNERALGAVFSDLDADGDLDLYVANDGHPNRLYLHEQAASAVGFRFVDATGDAGVGDSGSGMGIAAGDFTGDGRFDLHVTNWDTELNALYINESSGAASFEYATFRIGYAGLGNNQTGWGTTWADFDHDGDEDLFVTNGHVPIADLDEDREALRLYANLASQGRLGTLTDFTEQSGLGAVPPIRGRGSAVADYDNDGDLDIAINTIGGPALLIDNGLADGHWLTVVVDPPAPGTVVTVTTEDAVFVRELRAGTSYLATEDARLHFGLGSEAGLVGIEVRWPDGTTELIERSGIDRFVRVRGQILTS